MLIYLEMSVEGAAKMIISTGVIMPPDKAAHAELLSVARDDAKLIVERDPELASPRGGALRTLLYLFDRDEAVRLFRTG